MDARDLFKIGQRVKLSAVGLRHFRFDKSYVQHDIHLRGTVRGFGRYQDAIRVQRDGIATTNTYAMRFWEAE